MIYSLTTKQSTQDPGRWLHNGAVFPITPCYTSGYQVDYNGTEKYTRYLLDNGARNIMTTAGTTQFNLLTKQELRKINALVCQNVSLRGSKCILGLHPLNTHELILEIKLLNERFGYRRDSTSIMLLYPDRHYTDKAAINYFHQAAEVSELPVFVHGVFQRLHNWSAQLLSEIASHPNIIGIKEENESIASAQELCSQFRNKYKHPFDIVVAGGSIGRFKEIFNSGATSFLSGVGSLFPLIDNRAWTSVISQHKDVTYAIIELFEQPLFSIFMPLGWHPAMREGLKQIMSDGYGYDRQPYPVLTEHQKSQITAILTLIQKETSVCPTSYGY